MSVTTLGETTWRQAHQRFGIKRDDRRAHMVLLGKTGVGKSTLMANMILSDIYAGDGVAVLDPHGALIEEIILDRIPEHRIEDMIYVNPLDRDYPVPFNPLARVDPLYHHLVASGIIAMMKKMWADSWGNRLEHVLRYTLLSLMHYPGATLLDVSRLLLNQGFRAQVMASLPDEHLIDFWRHEFAGYAAAFRNDVNAPVLNKVGQFPANPLLRAMVGQAHNTFSIRKVMDSGKILLVNLSRGLLGEDASALLGEMFITNLWLSALSRQDQGEHLRRDCYLYIDEAHSLTGSFANMLAETRKYRLNTTLALQYLDQLSPDFRRALLGNIGTLITFRTGAEDAAYMAREFSPVVTEADVVNLAKFSMYLKLLIDGIPSPGFSAMTLPLQYGVTGHRERVIAYSQQTYGKRATPTMKSETNTAWLPPGAEPEDDPNG